MKKTAFILLFAFILSSCGTQGYGCKGKASWNQVVRKANRLY
jgi:starvation-inducible outer membrane lipoprotein